MRSRSRSDGRTQDRRGTFRRSSLDWAYLAVHNGDLDSRDNVGLRAIYDWTRDGVAFPALERWSWAAARPSCSSAWATTPRSR